MPISARALKDRAGGLGFNLVGLTPARPAPHLDAYLRWVEAGLHGDMAYLGRADRLARRRDLNVIVPGVQSLVVVGLDYGAARVPPAVLTDPGRGRVAAYAWGLDYHAVMLPRLEALADWLKAQAGGALTQRAYVDTGPLLERGHGHQAGLGFIGKNTLLIHPRRGSNFFLGELLTTAEFDVYDTPGPETRCGTCTRCLAACPTEAFVGPHVLDARRCISYLTIEHKGWIPADLRPRMGNWVFGCDVCQDVCPWQRFGVQTQEAGFQLVDEARAAPPLIDLLALDEAAFAARFTGTALHRLGRERLVRNACVAAGNCPPGQAAPELKAALRPLLADPGPLVRGHAAWALARLGGAWAAGVLRDTLNREREAAVQAELRHALRSLRPAD